jgi:hypothetical protein
MKILVALAMLLATAAGVAVNAPDRWEPVRFLLGSWKVEAAGEPGRGTVERTYALVLGDKFVEEHNTSRYEALPGREPEIHHHRGFLSFDKSRNTLMLRHFHEEGFINLYALDTDKSRATKLVFESVSFENFSNEWKARETYEVISRDEFIETFELAEPGKSFAVYSRNHFRRTK